MPASPGEKATSHEIMFNEALQAVQGGDRARARDLLTRLLKVRQDNADYWIWMSAVVETPKERIFCLKEVLRLDPQNYVARRGLVILGALSPDVSLVFPVKYQKRSWLPDFGDQAISKQRPALPAYQIALMGAVLVVLVGLIAFSFWGAQQQASAKKHKLVIIMPTDTATVTVEAQETPLPVVQITPAGSPVPLWMLLEATFTPTPYYVNTPHSVSEAYRIGLRAIQNQEWENANNFFRQAATDVAKSDPGAVDVLFYVAENLRLQGSLNDALEIYNQVIQQSPEFAPAYVGRARVRIAQNPQNLADAAIADLQIAVKNDPQYAEAYLELASLQLGAGKAQDVLDTLDSAPAPLLADSSLAHLYRAQAQILVEDYSNALVSARRANEMDITLLPAYRIIGEVLQKNGEVAGSVKPLTTYLTYEQDDALAWALLANAYFSAGEQAEALKALDRALRLDNSLARAYLQRAIIEIDMDDAEKALADFQAALRLDPTSYEASLGIGQALMALNYPGDAWDRFERTKKLAETEPQKAELTFWRAQSLERLGELDAAMRDYQALVELPEASVKSEWVQYAQGRISALTVQTPTATPRLPTPTVSKTSTRQPSRTPTPTKKP